jgi:PqqD family protein of HPr-rel-A system
VSAPPELRWRVPGDQQLLFEDFDDGIVLFDSKVGGTHLVNPTAAEALEVILDAPGLTAGEIHGRVLHRLALSEHALPLTALEELLRKLAELCLIVSEPA